MDGKVLDLKPIKIKYLRQFMDHFQNIGSAKNDDQSLQILTECAAIAMQEFVPELSDPAALEDVIDIKTLYEILDITADISMDRDKQEEGEVKKQATEEASSWDKLDLAKLEAEAFLVGIWKDYEELELSLSMPELLLTLNSKRELDYDEKKFLAAIQGVDLDKNSKKSNAWEEMKARVFSGGKATDPNDVTALQGINAQKAGFGIGLGLGYEDLREN